MTAWIPPQCCALEIRAQTGRSQSGNNLTTPVIHTSGTIFTIDGSTLVGMNPTTGQTFSVQMENSISSGSDGCTNFCTSPLPPPPSNYSNTSPPSIGSLLIAGDGYAYVPYSYTISSGSSANSGCGCGCMSSGSSTQFLNLLRVGPTGDSSEISLGEFSSAESGCECNYQGCGGGGYSAGATLPTLITNADQGALASYSVTYNNSPASYYLATTSGASLASNSQVAMVLEQTSPVQPVLQRADGSFVGTASSTVGNFMIAFTPSGGTLFTVPNDTPQIVTAGGGVIGASGTTYDQNGNVNGQLASMPTQSWGGNSYQLGSVDQVAETPIIVASLWAWQAGNPSGNGTAARPWSFVLIWQNDFTFTPDDPQDLPNLTTNIAYDATAIKQAALQALKDAYSGVPVTVVEGTTGGDAHAFVLNHQILTQLQSYGATDPNNIGNHQVDYINNMKDGQWAYKVVITNAQSETAALQQRTDLIAAIGRALGNTAAHEIAHQFLFLCCGMDANPVTDANARATFNAGTTNPIDDPSFWTGYYPSNPKIYLHWQDTGYSPAALQALGQCLGGGWRDFHGSSCHN